MRRAKIVCTIGPASSNKRTMTALIRSGMDVARLNFSHADHKTHEASAAMVRAEATRQKKTIALLQDLQGIKIRIGNVEGDALALRAGEEVSLYPGKNVSTAKKLFISYPALLQDVKTNETILIDDGFIKLQVTGRSKEALRAMVVEGGTLKSKKGVNFPSSKTTLHAFTEKDRKDIEFGIKLGVDYIAVSFVRTADDIERVLSWAKRRKILLPPLIAKIEKPEALDNINDIIEVADGIMVARGDLGVELPAEKVPVIQKMLIELANRKGKLVITATQMLESMTQHTKPTRAEASDVANAVLDGTDALMLSAETASGNYPVEAVQMMDTIIRYTEENLTHKITSVYDVGNRFTEATADGAVEAAHDIGAQAIIAFTNRGYTACLLAKFRPKVPIIAFTPDEKILRQMALYWGVTAKLIKYKPTKILEDPCMHEVEKSLIKDQIIKKGDNIVLVAGSPFLGKPNIIRLHKVI